MLTTNQRILIQTIKNLASLLAVMIGCGLIGYGLVAFSIWLFDGWFKGIVALITAVCFLSCGGLITYMCYVEARNL